MTLVIKYIHNCLKNDRYLIEDRFYVKKYTIRTDKKAIQKGAISLERNP